MNTAFSKESGAHNVAADLARQLGEGPLTAIVFFCAPAHDGAAIGAALRARFAGAQVIGCTSAGEFTERSHSTGAVSAIGLGPKHVRRAAAVLAHFDRGVDLGIGDAARALGESLGVDLRTADPKRYAGIVLFEGLRAKEEAANEALGNVAPFLSFVGGSAGDDLRFESTRVFVNGETSDDGAAMLLFDATTPFVVAKTCSFVPTGKRFTVTRANEAERVVYELDGRPVADAYADAVGRDPEELDASVFMSSPVGLMLDGVPFIRSPMQLLPDGGLRFYCRILEGMEVDLMRSTNLVEETRDVLEKVRSDLGGTLSGGLAFNCILRRLELDATHQHDRFLSAFAGANVAGFHTYGESWLGHMNQTLTGVFFA